MMVPERLHLAVFFLAVGVMATIPPQLNIDVLHKLGIDTSGSSPGNSRPLSSYIRHVFQQVQERQDVLRIPGDRDPRVKFYSSTSENSNGIIEFDLSRAPVIGNVTKMEVAFTGHIHQFLTLDIISPHKPTTVVSTVQTPQGPVADVTQLVADEISQSTITLQISIRTAENKNRIRHLRPVLAVFLDLNVSAFHERHKRFVVGDWGSAISQDTAETNNHCRLVPWAVKFEDIPLLNRFVLEPKSYLANNCEGNCPLHPIDPIFNPTNHVIVQAMANRTISYCCTPIEYGSQSLMFFENGTVQVIQTLTGMSVTRCACR